jgi:hypothetical protein
LTALFWVVMNVLLWRAQYGSHDAADPVPVRLVWRKILTAPDPSSLSIWQGERRLGFGHWVTGVGEEFAELDEAPPEGLLGKIRNYRLEFDGNLTWPGEELRLRFECAIKLSTNQNWQEFTLRVSSRPLVWEVRGRAAEQLVHFHTEDGDRKFDRAFRFAGPAGPGLLAALGMPAAANGSMAPDLRWEASSVFLSIGNEPIRVFRLQTRLLDRFRIRVYVSRAGEILRVELPNGIVLKHDQINVRTPDRS